MNATNDAQSRAARSGSNCAPRHLCRRGSILMEGVAILRDNEDEARRRVTQLFDGGPVQAFECAGRAFYFVSFLAPKRTMHDAVPGIPFVRTHEGLTSYDKDEGVPLVRSQSDRDRLHLYLGGLRYEVRLENAVDPIRWFDFGALQEIQAVPLAPPEAACDALEIREIDLRKEADVAPPVLDLAELLDRICKGEPTDPTNAPKEAMPLWPLFLALGALGWIGIMLSPWDLPWGPARSAIVYVAVLLLVATLWRLAIGPRDRRTSSVPTLAHTFGAVRSIVMGGRRRQHRGASSTHAGPPGQEAGNAEGVRAGDATDQRWLWAARVLLVLFVIVLATQVPLPEAPSLAGILSSILLGCLYLALLLVVGGGAIALAVALFRPVVQAFAAWLRRQIPNPRLRSRWVSRVFLGTAGIALFAFVVLRPRAFLSLIGIFALVALVLYLLEKISRRPRRSPPANTSGFAGPWGWGLGFLLFGMVRAASHSKSTGSLAPLFLLGALILTFGLVRRNRSAEGRIGAPGQATLASPPNIRQGLLSRFLPKLLSDLGLLPLLEKRQNAYVSNLFRMLDEGDVHEALRHAIPLSNEVKTSLSGKRGMLSWLAPRSDFVMGANKSAGEGSSLLFEPDLFEGLKKKYRTLFERLDRSGDIDKAAFVLAELLKESEEAVAYLERNKRIRLAAELAEARDLPPGLQVRLWFLAGDKQRALRIALKSGALMEAVHELERAGAPEAKELRVLWADKLAEAGSWIEAVDVLWPVEGSRHVAIDWIDRGIALEGLPGARMLAKKIALLSDPRFIETELKRDRFAKLLATSDPAKAPKAIQSVLFEEIRTQTSHLLAEGQWEIEPLVAFTEELLRIQNSHSAKVLARLVSRRLISECVKEIEIEAFAPAQSKRASNLARLRDKMLQYSGDLALKHDAKNVVRTKRGANPQRPKARLWIALMRGPHPWNGKPLCFAGHLSQPGFDAFNAPSFEAEEGIVCGFGASDVGLLDEAHVALCGYAPRFRTTKESWAWCLEQTFTAVPASVISFFEDWLIFKPQGFPSFQGGGILYVLRDGKVTAISKPAFMQLQRGDRVLLSDEYTPSRAPPSPSLFASPLRTHEVLAQLVRENGLLIDVSGPTLPAHRGPVELLEYAAVPTENPAASRWTPLDAREESLEITRGANDVGTIPATDAFQASDGRLVVALGDLGLRVYQSEGEHADGTRVAFDVRTPASELIPSDNGDRCIVIRWIRKGLARLSRLDLQTGECTPWADAEIYAYANTYDGKIWYVSKGDTVFAMDVQAKRWSHVWKVSEPSGHVHAISRNTRSLSFLMSSPMGQRRVVNDGADGYNTAIYERDRDMRLEKWAIELPAHTLRARTEATAPPDTGLPVGQDGNPARWRRTITISPEGDLMTYSHEGISNSILAVNHRSAWTGLEKDERAGLRSERATWDERWIAFTARVEDDLLVHVVDRAQTASRAYFRLEGTEDASIRLQSEVLVTSDPKGRVMVFSLRTGKVLRELRLR